MLKHWNQGKSIVSVIQPPSGGCVLKQSGSFRARGMPTQPPSGGCVLKLLFAGRFFQLRHQPPSGGCVLKQPVGWVSKRSGASRLQAAVC